MKYRFSLFLILVLIFFNISFSDSVNVIEKNEYVPVDIAGMGNAGVASYGKVGSIFVNPTASIIDKTFAKFFLLKLGLRSSVDLPLNLLSLYNSYGLGFLSSPINLSTISNSTLAYLLSLKFSLGLDGPVMFGWSGYGITIFLYDNISLNNRLKWGALLPYADLKLQGNVGAMINYSFKFDTPSFIDSIFGKGTLMYAGISLKPFLSLKVGDDRFDIVDIIGLINAPYVDTALFVESDIGLTIKKNKFGPANLALTFALKDFLPITSKWTRYGIIQTISSGSLTALATQTTNYGYYPLKFDIGASYVFPELISKYLIKDFGLYVDLRDILNFNESIFNKLKIGTDVRLLSILLLRAGLNGGYPCVGLGLDLPLLKLNIAYYTEELGSFPGANPNSVIKLDFDLMIF